MPIGTIGDLFARRPSVHGTMDADRAAVDDAPHAVPLAGVHEVGDGIDVDLPVALVREVRPAEGAGHGKDDLDPAHRPIDRLGVRDVADDDVGHAVQGGGLTRSRTSVRTS